MFQRAAFCKVSLDMQHLPKMLHWGFHAWRKRKKNQAVYLGTPAIPQYWKQHIPTCAVCSLHICWGFQSRREHRCLATGGQFWCSRKAKPVTRRSHCFQALAACSMLPLCALFTYPVVFFILNLSKWTLTHEKSWRKMSSLKKTFCLQEHLL